ncbi:MAG: hypothetical protein R3D66_01755 [Alphaproteobacteria bacterium]
MSDKPELDFTAHTPELAPCRNFTTQPGPAKEFEDTKNPSHTIQPYLVAGAFNPVTGSKLLIDYNTDYEDMIKFAQGDDQVIIRFGYRTKSASPTIWAM